METSNNPETFQNANSNYENVVSINEETTEEFDFDFDYDPNDMYYELASRKY